MLARSVKFNSYLRRVFMSLFTHSSSSELRVGVLKKEKRLRRSSSKVRLRELVHLSMSSPAVLNKPTVPPGCILVSEAWRRTQLVECLSKHTHVMLTEGLGIADFHPSEEAAVIFISEADLISGNAYRRRVVKFRQANASLRGVIVAQKTQLTNEQFGSLQKFVVIELGLTLIPVSSIEEAAQLLGQMVTCEAKMNANPFRMKTKPVNTPDAALLATTTMIPGLGEKKALLLLKHFGSLKGLCNATQDSVAEVVGPSTASSVYHFFHSVK